MAELHGHRVPGPAERVRHNADYDNLDRGSITLMSRLSSRRSSTATEVMVAFIDDNRGAFWVEPIYDAALRTRGAMRAGD
jgi:hypothetical protein